MMKSDNLFLRYEVRGEIKTVRLDDYFPLGTPVGLMKIDIEGHEWSAVSDSGAHKFFTDPVNRPPIIFGELYHSIYGKGCLAGDGKYIETMLSRDYVVSAPLSTEYVSTLQDVCKKPPVNAVFTDKALSSFFPFPAPNK